jgi:hypothetical protein
LNASSQASDSLPAGRDAIRRPYRIRAVFLPGHDTTVTGAGSRWRYFMIER